MNKSPLVRRSLMFVFLGMALTAQAWDYTGHRIVNQLALASLPDGFPAFVREPANAARVAFLAGEPDRWRNVGDLPIKQYNGLDHYIDLEDLTDAGLAPETVSPLRYVFALQYAAGRAAHADKFPPIEASKNLDHSREWCGFAPWAITEYYGKLKSAFSYWKTYQDAGTPEEVANAQENIIYLMGVMGHYVGDCAQPLHTTQQHNGWTGPNPHGYTKWSGIHSWIDGGFIAKAGITYEAIVPRAVPAAPLPMAVAADGRDPMFTDVMNYVVAQNKFVEPLYALEKTGAFKANGAATSGAGRRFIEDRLLTGGEMLARVWVTAWRQAAPDVYLKAQLLKRQAAGPAPAAKP